MKSDQHFTRVTISLRVAQMPSVTLIERIANLIKTIGWVGGRNYEVVVDTMSIQEFDELEGGSDE